MSGPKGDRLTREPPSVEGTGLLPPGNPLSAPMTLDDFRRWRLRTTDLGLLLALLLMLLGLLSPGVSEAKGLLPMWTDVFARLESWMGLLMMLRS